MASPFVFFDVNIKDLSTKRKRNDKPTNMKVKDCDLSCDKKSF